MFPRSYSCSTPLEISVIHRLKRQQHLQKSPPKTLSVSSQVKYAAAINLSTLTCSPRDQPAVAGRAVASAEEVAKEKQLNYQLGFDLVFRFADTLGVGSASE